MKIFPKRAVGGQALQKLSLTRFFASIQVLAISVFLFSGFAASTSDAYSQEHSSGMHVLAKSGNQNARNGFVSFVTSKRGQEDNKVINKLKTDPFRIDKDLRSFLGEEAIKIISDYDYVLYAKVSKELPFERVFRDGELALKLDSIKKLSQKNVKSLKKILLNRDNYMFSPIADCIFDTSDAIIFIKNSKRYYIFVSNRCTQWFFSFQNEIIVNSGKISGFHPAEREFSEWLTATYKDGVKGD